MGSARRCGWLTRLGVFDGGVPVGVVALEGTDFAVTRAVHTESWVGLAHQRRRVDLVARAALQHVAFQGHGAESALTEVLPDNVGSQTACRKLGYIHDGTSRDARGSEAPVSDRLRLDRDPWVAADRPEVTVNGLAHSVRHFGVDRQSAFHPGDHVDGGRVATVGSGTACWPRPRRPAQGAAKGSSGRCC